jgi:hypothetical protein
VTPDEFDTSLMNLLSIYLDGALVTDYVICVNMSLDDNDCKMWTYAPPGQRMTSTMGLLNAGSLVTNTDFISGRIPDSG